MTLLTIDELRELAPGYVMGSLTDLELAQFASALKDPALRTLLEPELEAHHAAVAFLATDFVVTPPADLRQRVVDRVASEHGAPYQLANTEEFSATPRTVNALPPVRAVRVTPPPMALVPRRSSKSAWATAGVMGLALAASLFFAFNLRSRVDALSSELATQKLMAERLGERLAEREATVNALTNPDNDLMVVRLVANEAEGPSMRVFWNQSTGEAVVHAKNFAQLKKDRTYVLWMIRDGKPESLQLFSPDVDGARTINAVALPQDPTGIVAFAVTEEPAGGSPQPTMQPFLIGQVRGKSE